jgi:DNA-binding response OmpR family regulator
MRVLVAGDTHGTVEPLRAHFLQKRCEVETAYTSEEIKRKLLGNSFDILICGFLMSEEYSLRIIEIVRHLSDVRLLFLTGKRDSGFSTKVLNLGADDCLTSPASFFELDARVLRLCHRNMNLSFRETKIVLNQKDNTVEIDMSCQTVKKNGRHVSLTKMEYRILLYFALNKGRLVSKADLEKILFRSSALLGGEPRGSSVGAHICNLRRKFKTTLSIKTVSYHGFILEAGIK